MSRFHVHIAVEALDENIRFYSAVLGCEPVVRKRDYAKWSPPGPKPVPAARPRCPAVAAEEPL